jgi:hypothetical protein
VLVVLQANQGLYCKINQPDVMVSIPMDVDLYVVMPNSNTLAPVDPSQRLAHAAQIAGFKLSPSWFEVESPES